MPRSSDKLEGRVVVASEKFTVRALARHGARRMDVVPEGRARTQALVLLPLGALEDPEQDGLRGARADDARRSGGAARG